MQTEILNGGERISKFDVEWLDDCELILFNRRVVKGEDPYSETNSDTLHINIVQINKEFHVIEYYFHSRLDRLVRDTMFTEERY